MLFVILETSLFGGCLVPHAVVIERGPESFGAYVPDPPGCVAVGRSREEVLDLIREAVAFHIEGMHESGEMVPPPNSETEYVEVVSPRRSLYFSGCGNSSPSATRNGRRDFCEIRELPDAGRRDIVAEFRSRGSRETGTWR